MFYTTIFWIGPFTACLKNCTCLCHLSSAPDDNSHLENISLFLAHLLKRLLLPVTMLKKIDFEDIAKCQKSIAFLRSLFKNICEICSTAHYMSLFIDTEIICNFSKQIIIFGQNTFIHNYCCFGAAQGCPRNPRSGPEGIFSLLKHT